jgi:hypothetical protein
MGLKIPLARVGKRLVKRIE